MESNDINEEINLKTWINKIEPISQANIEFQIFVIEIVTISLEDPYENAISSNQKYCRNLIFKEKTDNYRLFDKCLITFKLQNDIPIVIFNHTG